MRLGERTALTARAAAMGGAYMFTKDAAANLRKKDDSYNSAIGGAFAGSLLGLRCAWIWISSFTRFALQILTCDQTALHLQSSAMALPSALSLPHSHSPAAS